MRPHTSFVIGFHGCERALGLRLIAGETTLTAKKKDYHWLGSGVYFWEYDQERAFEWAKEKASRNEIEDPFVVGAVIELGRCLIYLFARTSLSFEPRMKAYRHGTQSPERRCRKTPRHPRINDKKIK